MKNAQCAHGFRLQVRLGEQGDDPVSSSSARTEPTAMAVREAKGFWNLLYLVSMPDLKM